MKGPCDAMFCRTVIICFDTPTRPRLVQRFCHLLAPGGWLHIGHFETIFDQKTAFRLRGPTIYQKES
ncbi:MAG: chemotaxis protein CheR [Proteobacteria bacterium]|nr:chemotaxis protein CheR [Pseudomonadota bacterium]